jgi:hypothetical protein
MLEVGNVLPNFKEYLDLAKSFHPFFPSKCPILPRAEYYYNIPITNYLEGTFTLAGKMVKLPNGEYRWKISLRSRDDPEGGLIMFILEVKRAQNIDSF